MTIKKTKWGQVINRSSIKLLVIENDSGKPTAHILGQKKKTPTGLDADGFKRFDGKTILGNKTWWKITDWSTADIYQINNDILIPVSLTVPVADKHFGEYVIDKSENWGIELTYVTGIIKNKKRKTIGYRTDRLGEISKSKGITLAEQGKLDNVDIIHKKTGIFLRSKKNSLLKDNLS